MFRRLLSLSVCAVVSTGALHIPSRAPEGEGTAAMNSSAVQVPADTEWPAYGNDPGGSRFSALEQIGTGNVGELEEVWRYRTGESLDELDEHRAVSEGTPLLVEGTLYVSTPLGRVVALDPATGEELWRTDPEAGSGRGVSRGVSSWIDPDAEAGTICRSRIFVATPVARLHALDATTGEPCTEFGRGGVIDLQRGILVRNNYRVSSPPAIVNGVVIVGSAIGGNALARDTRGIVRAFDARSGRTLWRWDPLMRTAPERPPTRAQAAIPVRTGAANAWAPMSADPERDLVFVPTSSASPDHYGGKRPGDNLYSDSVVALRASTGELVWHFQIVHHDIWDYDVSTQPTLFTWRQSPGDPGIPAVLVGTKTGHVFVLGRETGEPLLPVREVTVPTAAVPGEEPSTTQPIPVAPPSLVQGGPTPDRVFGLDPESRRWCRERVRALRNDGLFTPPSVEGSLVFPAETGGFNWGGLSVHPELGLAIGNTSRLAAAIWLIPRNEFDANQVDAWRRDNPTVTVGLQRGSRYVMRRELLITPEGVPCNEPPWGQLAAIDLGSGEIAWQVPLGITPAAADHPDAASWGARNLGGSLVTGGGLAFIAAALDDTFRAFDVGTGELLWETPLPAGGQATPMTYAIDGRQYVVLVAGGHGGMGTTLGDYVVAFALP